MCGLCLASVVSIIIVNMLFLPYLLSSLSSWKSKLAPEAFVNWFHLRVQSKAAGISELIWTFDSCICPQPVF